LFFSTLLTDKGHPSIINGNDDEAKNGAGSWVSGGLRWTGVFITRGPIVFEEVKMFEGIDKRQKMVRQRGMPWVRVHAVNGVDNSAEGIVVATSA
jgi:hypothetical protein